MPGPRERPWSPSAIYGDVKRGVGILANPLYTGRVVWNRSKWDRHPDRGKRQRCERPEHEWIVTDAPELRIIAPALWEGVQKRISEQHKASQAVRDKLHKGARTGAGPKYLFSSLLRCGVCGGSYVIVDYRYGCGAHMKRGPTVCSNAIRVSRQLLEERLLAGIKRELFTPEGIAIFTQEVARLLQDRQQRRRPDDENLQKRLKKIDSAIANILAAIREGIRTPSTKADLERAEAERAAVENELKIARTATACVPKMIPDAIDRYREIVAGLEGALQRDVARARSQIKAILGDEIRLVPAEDGYLKAELTGDYRALFGTTPAGQISLVAAEGCQRYLQLFKARIPRIE